MPSGKVHWKFYQRFRVLAWACSIALIPIDWRMGLGFWVGYMIIARYIDPDLDHRNMTQTEYRAMRELGFVGSLLVAYFMPYGYLLPHRSFMSHSPLISTVIRFIYLFWWLFLLIYWVDLTVLINNMMLFVGMYLGLSLADLIHIVLDRVKK